MRRPSTQAVDWLLVLMSIVSVVVSWSIVTARYGGPDEPAHTIRAAAVASGDFYGAPTVDLPPGYRTVQVPEPLTTGDPSCFRHDPERSASCAQISGDPDRIVSVATSAGSFPPLYYMAIGTPPKLVGATEHAMAYRLSSVLLTAAVLSTVLVRLRRWDHRPEALLFACAIPPSAWFLFGVANTSGLEIALTLLTWVMIAELARGRIPTSGLRLSVVTLPLATAIMIRPAALLTAPAVLATAFIMTPRAVRRSCTSARAGIALVGPLALAAAGTACWYALVPPPGNDPRTALAISHGQALRQSLGGVGSTIAEAVGAMGWLEFTAPFVAQAVWWVGALLAVICVVANWRLHRRCVTAITVLISLSVLLPVGFEVLVADRYGLIWQGRYSVGVLMGILAIGAVAGVPLRLTNAPRILVLLSAVVSLISIWHASRRYVVGTNGPLIFDHSATSKASMITWLALANAALGMTLISQLWRSPIATRSARIRTN